MNGGKRGRFGDERGQGMTEYILIVVLVAVASIALWKAFGTRIKELVMGSTQAITEQTKDVIDDSGGYQSGPSGGR